MNVDIVNNYGIVPFDYQKIVNDVSKVVYDKFKSEKDATVILVNLDTIHEMNYEYRHLDRPTDVISFEEKDDDGYPLDDYLGEIFICIDKVFEQAKEYGHSNEREFAFLLCHGLLHIHGYDHMTEEDEKVMFALQDELLDKTEYKRNK